MSPRSFVFSVWVANSKDATKTVAALETIAANNFTVQKEGGRVLVSASMRAIFPSSPVPFAELDAAPSKANANASCVLISVGAVPPSPFLKKTTPGTCKSCH